MFLPPQEGAISSEYPAKSAYLNDKRNQYFSTWQKGKTSPVTGKLCRFNPFSCIKSSILQDLTVPQNSADNYVSVHNGQVSL